MTSHISPAPALQHALQGAWERSDQLFNMLVEDALLDRPIGLRHPFLFYVGHLPAFMWNQIGCGVLQLSSESEELDRLFERGIDPLSQEGAESATISTWPELDDILSYRDRLRDWVLRESFQLVEERVGDNLADCFRVHHLVLEHELMHHETLLYMLQEQPHARKRQGTLPGPVLGPPPPRLNTAVEVPAGRVRIGGAFDSQPFGWDNEFPVSIEQVDAFDIDALPVTVTDWRRFMADGGPRPHGWVERGGAHFVRSLWTDVPVEDVGGWPVQVCQTQASAYAAWMGGRLPTEAELNHAAYGSLDGGLREYPWGNEALGARHGVVNFVRWSPEPVGRRKAGASAWGVEELVGNGWEWTSTPFRPLPGFTAWARTYPGYSADFFDDEHFVVFGGSWATDKRLLRRSFRNWYQAHYPFVFSKFRVAR